MANKNKTMMSSLSIFQFILMIFVGASFFSLVLGGISDSLTVETKLEVGASYPTILNVTIDDSASNITLVANQTKTVTCVARIVDFNNESNIANVTGALYDINNATYGDSPDNNNYYMNSSCSINTTFGSWLMEGEEYTDDIYHVLSTCTFEVEYYSNPSDWNCSILVTDQDLLQDQSDDSIEILTLLAMGIQDIIDYGTVNATYVSDEQQVDVENLGNIQMDLTISAYAHTPGDGLAMNCTLGLNKTILMDHERYNLSESTPGDISQGVFNVNYKNVNSSTVNENISLNYRHNDTISEAINPTYWRLHVPTGVGGTCEGNVVFGAVSD